MDFFIALCLSSFESLCEEVLLEKDKDLKLDLLEHDELEKENEDENMEVL